MTCGAVVLRAGTRRRAPCAPFGYSWECVCVADSGHDGACICQCGFSPDRCHDCTGDPCPCGKPGLVAVDDATLEPPTKEPA